jgi:diamine N-acetyltransferase
LAKKINIKYFQGEENILDDVQDLWQALNQHLCQCSTYFKSHYMRMTFEKRKNKLLSKTQNNKLHVDIAVDEDTGQRIGYLISSINQEKTGEIDSIFVYPEYRGTGVGGMLMRNALAWMDQNGAQEKIVEATFGNETAWGFYGRFGFLPRKTLLQRQ